MDTDTKNQLDALCHKVIGAAYTVANTLGAGFFEKVYERALLVELERLGIAAAGQVPCTVLYRGVEVGQYVGDIVVEGRLAVELKCVERLAPIHLAQCLNYLRATGMELCLLMNFERPRLEVRRVILDRPAVTAMPLRRFSHG